MSKKLSNKSVLLAVLVMILLPDNSLAFNDEVRCQMLKDAISFCPTQLKSYLTDNFELVHDGIHFADRNKHALSSIRPDDTKVLYDATVNDLREGKLNDENTIHRFGVLACFVAETIYPDNSKASSSLVPKKVVYDGFQKVANVDSNVSRLVTKYRKPYRHSRNRQVTDFLYYVAVNEIVDHWISAWKAGGKEPGLLSPQGTKIARKNAVIHFMRRG
jgi:hypothetical protein